VAIRAHAMGLARAKRPKNVRRAIERAMYVP
jgi:hypothetical protein